MLEVRLPGIFDIKYKAKSIRVSSHPAPSPSAYLVASVRPPHRREKLAGLLWPDTLEETARDNLRHALWWVCKALPPKPIIEYLQGDDLSIAFNSSAGYFHSLQ